MRKRRVSRVEEFDVQLRFTRLQAKRIICEQAVTPHTAPLALPPRQARFSRPPHVGPLHQAAIATVPQFLAIVDMRLRAVARICVRSQ